MDKYDYVQGFCTQLRYNGLWPVLYQGTSGNYKKVRMACNSARNDCDKNCKVIDNAVEVFPIEKEWTLLDSKMDEK